MTDVGEICEEAMGAVAFSGGPGVGFLEGCRLYLEHRNIPEHEIPGFYCRLSEALLHRGRRDEAVECARIVFDLRPEEEKITSLCAWVFSNCGRHEEAGAAYERLLGSRSEWAEGHRHASGSFAVAGQMDRAIFHARAASDLDPNSFEFALHAAGLFEAEARYEEAADYFTRAVAIEPSDSCALRRLSAAQFALERRDEAVAIALRAVALDPCDRLNALQATEFLLRCGRLEEAADIVLNAVDIHPQDAVALRLLSATQMLRGRTEEALGGRSGARPRAGECGISLASGEPSLPARTPR